MNKSSISKILVLIILSNIAYSDDLLEFSGDVCVGAFG